MWPTTFLSKSSKPDNAQGKQKHWLQWQRKTEIVVKIPALRRVSSCSLVTPVKDQRDLWLSMSFTQYDNGKSQVRIAPVSWKGRPPHTSASSRTFSRLTAKPLAALAVKTLKDTMQTRKDIQELTEEASDEDFCSSPSNHVSIQSCEKYWIPGLWNWRSAPGKPCESLKYLGHPL